MKYLKISIGIFFALALSRFIPHPPNFTSLIALSFYIPALLGLRYLPALILSFALTDIFFGFHNTLLFTWGSVIFIGYISLYFANSLGLRILGSLFGACLFYLITNFGVWSLGSYGYSLNGLVASYTMALPFFVNSLISTFICSGVIEISYKLINIKKQLIK